MISIGKFKGIVFDLDGVLVDTEYYQWQGWVETLKPYGIIFTEEDKFAYTGKNVTIIAEEIIKRYRLNIKLEELVKKKETLIMKWFKTKDIRLMKYAKESVDYFKKLGLKVAVCTSGPREETLLKLEKTGLLEKFYSISCRNDVKRGKPFPDLYLDAVKKLGLKVGECLAFEDTQYGLQSAKEAGLTCVAVPQEFTIGQDFSKADFVFKDLEEAINNIRMG